MATTPPLDSLKDLANPEGTICDSEARSGQIATWTEFRLPRTLCALKVMLRKRFIDESSEGAVERQIDKDLLESVSIVTVLRDASG